MKCIIVIKGVSDIEYETIRADLIQQLESQKKALPLFTRLPAEDPDIEIIWVDEEMALKMFIESSRLNWEHYHEGR